MDGLGLACGLPLVICVLPSQLLLWSGAFIRSPGIDHFGLGLFSVADRVAIFHMGGVGFLFAMAITNRRSRTDKSKAPC